MGKLELLQQDEFALNRAQTVNEGNQTHFVFYILIFSRWLVVFFLFLFLYFSLLYVDWPTVSGITLAARFLQSMSLP